MDKLVTLKNFLNYLVNLIYSYISYHVAIPHLVIYAAEMYAHMDQKRGKYVLVTELFVLDPKWYSANIRHQWCR